MDTVSIVFKAISLIPQFLPRPKPPVIDYTTLREAMPKPIFPEISATEVRVETSPTPTLVNPPAVQEVATACMACSRSHLSTVSGALNEAMRFARESGVANPEVQRRIMMAEDEINLLERIDLSPQSLQNSPAEEAQVAREYLPRIRKLRQDIGSVASVDQLETTAAEASMLGQEFRLRHMQLKGVDLSPILSLAKRVQSGEISMEAAKAKLREILPEEE